MTHPQVPGKSTTGRSHPQTPGLTPAAQSRGAPSSLPQAPAVSTKQGWVVGLEPWLPAEPEVRAAPLRGGLSIQPPRRRLHPEPPLRGLQPSSALLSLCDSSRRNEEPSGTVEVESFCLHSPWPRQLGFAGVRSGGTGVVRGDHVWFSSPKPGCSKTTHPEEHKRPNTPSVLISLVPDEESLNLPRP